MNNTDDFAEELKQAFTGSEESTEKIISMLYPLVMSSIKKYYLTEKNYDDLLQEGALIIIESVKNFDKNKNIPFLGYIKARLKYLYMNLSSKSIRRSFDSLNKEISADNNGSIELIELLADENSDIEKEIIKNEDVTLLNKYLPYLSKRETQVIEMYYFQRKNLFQIAEELNIAYRTAVNTKVNGIKKLREFMSI